MRTNESEYKRLEVAIYDLKTENAKLRKDKERLDWLVDNTAISMLLKDEDGEEWWVELDYSEARNDIDKQMKEAQ